MTRNIYDAADDLDCTHEPRALNAIAHEARRNGYRARVVRDHVLVTSLDGGVLATRSARRLAEWMRY